MDLNKKNCTRFTYCCISVEFKARLRYRISAGLTSSHRYSSGVVNVYLQNTWMLKNIVPNILQRLSYDEQKHEFNVMSTISVAVFAVYSTFLFISIFHHISLRHRIDNRIRPLERSTIPSDSWPKGKIAHTRRKKGTAVSTEPIRAHLPNIIESPAGDLFRIQ